MKHIMIVLVATLIGIGLILESSSVSLAQEPENTLAELKRDPWQAGTLPYLPKQRSPSARSIEAVMAERFEAITSNVLSSRTRIVYQSYVAGGWGINYAHGNGNYPTSISRYGTDLRPNLNSDATRVVFVSNRTGRFEIYSVNTDRTNLVQLTDTDELESDPMWSPDDNNIVYRRRRGSTWTLYKMAADGSGQKQLTRASGGENDIHPSWSPDGRKIVWVRARDDGTGKIYIMNADGSGQHAISERLPYLQFTRWSPDGEHLAFDFDADGDGLNELGIMKADGTGDILVYDPGPGLIDLWMGSWSPEGQHLMFSIVLYVIDSNQLYIQDSSIAALSLDTGKLTLIEENEIDMLPDWEAWDLLEPVSSMEPLETISASPIQLIWSGKDHGPAGLSGFDVQVRDSEDGIWQVWLKDSNLTSAGYKGVGGHSYDFRVRAGDKAGNVEEWRTSPDAVTTVENLPPISTVNKLSPLTRLNSTMLRWQNYDPGGSGVEYSEAQRRLDGTNEWQAWRSNMTTPYAFLPSPDGNTYHYRVRSVDKASNTEAWSGTIGDTWTTLYTWAISSTVTDVRDNSLSEVQLVTQDEVVASIDFEGTNSTYIVSKNPEYETTWQANDYGDLPLTLFDLPRDYWGITQDSEITVALPPPDNIFQDSHFENSEPDTAWKKDEGWWQIELKDWHTGQQALALGCQTPAFSPAEEAPVGSPASAYEPTSFSDAAIDQEGRVHVVFSNLVHDELTYVYRSQEGVWSSPKVLARLDGDNHAFSPAARIAVDDIGAVHIVWTVGITPYQSQIHYLRRAPNGEWGNQVILPGTSSRNYISNLKVAPNGHVHVVWHTWLRDDEHTFILYYSDSSPGSDTWSDPYVVFSRSRGGGGNPEAHLIAAEDGTTHIAWLSRSSMYGYNDMVWYRQRHPDGWWRDSREIYNSYQDRLQNLQLAVAENNAGIHLAWNRTENGSAAFYAHLPSITGKIDIVTYNHSHIIKGFGVDNGGTVHYVRSNSQQSEQGYYYIQHRADGTIVESLRLPHFEQYALDFPKVFVSKDGSTSIFSTHWRNGIYHMKRTALGVWTVPAIIERSDLSTSSTNESVAILTMIVDEDSRGRQHVLWDQWDGPLYTQSIFQDAPAGNGSITQSAKLPLTMSDPTLSFVYQFHQTSDANPSQFEVVVESEDGAQTIFETIEYQPEWIHTWVDLSSWLGQEIAVRFRVNQSASSPCATFRLDEITLGSATAPDLWISPMPATAQPRESTELQISYGNQGDGLAANTQISLTLPIDFQYHSASPEPDGLVGQLLNWRIGDLPLDPLQSSVTISGTVDANVPLETTLSYPVQIWSDTIEYELANNKAKGWLFVGGQEIYMPVIHR